MDTSTKPITLLRVGDPNVDACEGDACLIPEHHTQAAVNRAVDDDRI